jgi:hypothetical protein
MEGATRCASFLDVSGQRPVAFAYPIDRAAYRRRNLIKRAFGPVKIGSSSPRAMTDWPSTFNFMAAIDLVTLATQ